MIMICSTHNLVNLTVHPVTALAYGASAAPVWPAGYAANKAFQQTDPGVTPLAGYQ